MQTSILTPIASDIAIVCQKYNEIAVACHMILLFANQGNEMNYVVAAVNIS